MPPLTESFSNCMPATFKHTFVSLVRRTIYIESASATTITTTTIVVVVVNEMITAVTA